MRNPDRAGHQVSNENQKKKRHLETYHHEEYVKIFPGKSGAKVRRTATGLAAQGTADTGLEAEPAAKGGGGGGAADVTAAVQKLSAVEAHRVICKLAASSDAARALVLDAVKAEAAQSKGPGAKAGAPSGAPPAKGGGAAATPARVAPELAAAAHRTEDSTTKGDGIDAQAIHEVGKGMREDVGKDLEKDVGDEVTRADATRRNEDIIRHGNTPECALQVEEGPVEDWKEKQMQWYYYCLKCELGRDYHLPIVDYSQELPVWMVRDRIPILIKIGERKCLTGDHLKSLRNKGISELYWVTLKQPKSGAIREIWVPDIAIKDVYDEPMGGLKRFNALNS